MAKGHTLSYYLYKSYRHNQDMTFIVEMGIDKDYIVKNNNNINLNDEGGK